MLTTEDKEYLRKLARKAGDVIMDIFNSKDFGVEYKEDDSPLTRADKASHNIIVANLKERFPEFPIISEEDKNTIPFDQRESWDMFWLIDPLDGTKEFIKREKDFTVNIALILKEDPFWGVVYAPARNWLYYGGPFDQSQKNISGKETRLLPFKENIDRETIVAVRSKSHAKPEEEIVLKDYGVTNTVSMGSSLKFCLVAEGTADIYFRAGPTWEWDTAAAHAVVLGADGIIKDGNSPLTYNKPSLLNENGFLCLRNDLRKKQI